MLQDAEVLASAWTMWPVRLVPWVFGKVLFGCVYRDFHWHPVRDWHDCRVRGFLGLWIWALAGEQPTVFS